MNSWHWKELKGITLGNPITLLVVVSRRFLETRNLYWEIYLMQATLRPLVQNARDVLNYCFTPSPLVSFAAIFWDVTQCSPKKWLLTTEPHFFTDISQSQLRFHFQELVRARYVLWNLPNQRMFFIFVSRHRRCHKWICGFRDAKKYWRCLSELCS